MSYRAGVSAAAAKVLRVEPGSPQVTCDGCGVVRTIRADVPPPVWLLDGRAAPGWRLVRDSKGRWDYCPACSRGVRA